jgi:hypothetical protein
MSDNEDSPPNPLAIETSSAYGQSAAEEFVAELPGERFAACKERFTNLLVESVTFSGTNEGRFELPPEWQFFVLIGHHPKDAEAKAFWYEVGRPDHDPQFVDGFNRGLLTLFAQ